MRRYLLLFAFLASVAGPSLAFGQGTIPGIDWRSFQIVPKAKIGYKLLGLNINLDSPVAEVTSPFIISPVWGSLLDTFPLGFKLPGADLAVGEIGLNVLTPRGLNLFLNLSGSLPRRVISHTTVGPGIGVLTPQSAAWTGSRVQWYGLDLGGSYQVAPSMAVLAGLKLDCTSLRLSDPRPDGSYSYPIFFFAPIFTINNSLDNYAGDLRTNLAIPYLGVQFLGPQFRGSLRIGLAGANVTLPLRLTDGGVYFANIFLGIIGRQDISEEARYRFKNSGIYLDGSFELDVNVWDGWKLTCWAEGSWMKVTGSGDIDLTGQSTGAIFPLFGLFAFPPTSYSASSGGKSTVRQYSLSVGVSGVLNF